MHLINVLKILSDSLGFRRRAVHSEGGRTPVSYRSQDADAYGGPNVSSQSACDLFYLFFYSGIWPMALLSLRLV